MNSDQSSTLWNQFVEAHRAYLAASQNFLSQGDGRVDVLRRALRGADRLSALSVARSLPLDIRRELFGEWVYLASWGHGAIQLVRDMILALPRDWVIARIEREAEPYLAKGSDEEYRRFLELYTQLDSRLARSLAERAACSGNPDIREAGEDFLQRQGATG